MLEIAKKRATDIGLHINLVAMDVEQLCFPDNSFDTVFETMSLCTFPDPITALQKMARVCRENGHILLFDHGRSSNVWLARHQDRNVEQYAESLGCRWNLDHIAIVQEAGLEIIAADRKLLGVYYLIDTTPS